MWACPTNQRGGVKVGVAFGGVAKRVEAVRAWPWGVWPGKGVGPKAWAWPERAKEMGLKGGGAKWAWSVRGRDQKEGKGWGQRGGVGPCGPRMGVATDGV